MAENRKSGVEKPRLGARVPRRVLCPRCGEISTWEGNPFRPFCSERCRMIDLGSWASEDYKISTPAAPKDPDEE